MVNIQRCEIKTFFYILQLKYLAFRLKHGKIELCTYDLISSFTD